MSGLKLVSHLRFRTGSVLVLECDHGEIGHVGRASLDRSGVAEKHITELGSTGEDTTFHETNGDSFG